LEIHKDFGTSVEQRTLHQVPAPLKRAVEMAGYGPDPAERTRARHRAHWVQRTLPAEQHIGSLIEKQRDSYSYRPMTAQLEWIIKGHYKEVTAEFTKVRVARDKKDKKED
jgi:hypothetical protein